MTPAPPHNLKQTMRTILAFALIAGCGCNRSKTAEPVAVAVTPDPTPEVVVVAVSAPAAVEVAPQPTPVMPSFAFPADAAGAAVSKVLTPPAPPPPPTERFGAAQKPRDVPARVMEPDTGSRAALQPPRIALPPSAAVKPVPPRESLPVEIGMNAQGVPAKPKLPDAAVPTPRARDVNLPPELPILGRQANDRAGLDDPTVEAGHAVIVLPLVSVPLPAALFQRVALPDPFEFGEQVRPKVPPGAEPSAVPVPVNPKRPK